MKIGFYNDYRPCLVKEDGVVDITAQTGELPGGSAQLWLERLIENWDTLRPNLEQAAREGTTIPLDQVQLRAPLPRPGKVINGRTNFMEGVPIDPPRPLQTFFKSPDAVIGPGETIVLPKFRPTIFNHEAELCAVIGKVAKEVSVEEAMDHVFGYACGVDVSARAPESGELGLSGEYGKSFDTFLPLGPAITTRDEVLNPNDLRVRYWVNGVLRQDYRTEDMEHSVAYVVATLSHNMTLKPGDVIMCGTNHAGLGPLQDGDVGEIEIDIVGRMSNPVRDDLKRKWNPEQVRHASEMQARRESLKGTPNPGTWPFSPRS